MRRCDVHIQVYNERWKAFREAYSARPPGEITVKELAEIAAKKCNLSVATMIKFINTHLSVSHKKMMKTWIKPVSLYEVRLAGIRAAKGLLPEDYSLDQLVEVAAKELGLSEKSMKNYIRMRLRKEHRREFGLRTIDVPFVTYRDHEL